ncbi:MAG: FecCD family ABC transporter permease [Brachymonas sp.]|jgi:iron complex transport system permease protein
MSTPASSLPQGSGLANLENLAPRRLAWHWRRQKSTWLLIAALLPAIFVAAWAGAVPVAWDDWMSLTQLGSGEALSGSAYVLWELRLPRIAFALLIGAALGLCGALTQGLFRNPLADPGLLGVSSGAACAAALSIVFLGSVQQLLPASARFWLLPAAAFAGALSVCFLLDRVARWLTAESIAGLLLTGIALNALTAAVIGLCTYLASDEQLRNLSFWTLGSLAAASWTLAAVLLVLLALAFWQMRRLLTAMNALALGEEAAQHVGIPVKKLRTHVIILVALISGFAVAWCGMIGFIGLVAPHMVRMLVGPDQRQLAPLSMLMGALLLLLADTLARTAAIPAEIPVGIFTALLGAPFFMVLLLRMRKGS